jgi:hypothetical protein
MDMEQQVVEAITTELKRQAELSGGALKVAGGADGRLTVQGVINLETLAMAVVGAVAGGP